MKRHYSVTNQDGSVTILEIVPVNLVYASPEECIQKWPEAQRSQVVSVRQIEAGSWPTDRTFRDAWKPDLTVDMSKALELCAKPKLRAWREPKLADLDIKVRRAMREAPEDVPALQEKYQPLLDVTDHPSLIDAKTPEELKAAIEALTME